MKYIDYYQALGVEKNASDADIKKAYRKLAHLYHPDVSSDPAGEEKFKLIAEAWATLKNPQKREQYDSLGQQTGGEHMTPPPDWQQRYGAAATAFDDVDLADLLNAMRTGRSGLHGAPAGHDEHARRHGGINGQSPGRQTAFAHSGEDVTVSVRVALEMLQKGGETDITVEVPDYDQHGLPHRHMHTFRVRIPKASCEGQRLRLTGKGEPGQHGGKNGDLYVVLKHAAHPLFRVCGCDLSLDLPITPWEAVLGSVALVPTLAGAVELNIRPGTAGGQKLRLAGRGLPMPDGKFGDLIAVVQIVLPKDINEAEKALYAQLAASADFQPRAHFKLYQPGAK